MSDLKIIVKSSDCKCMSLYIPKVALPSDNNHRYCILGGYWSYTNVYGGYIDISRSSIKLLSFAYGSTDYLNTAELFLYYRN